MDRYACNYGAHCVTPLPGQPQVAVTHAFFVHPALRGKGYGKRLKQSQMRILAEHAFDYGICTVRSDNHAQKSILASIGWNHLDTFHSRAQDTEIEIWGRPVPQSQQTGDSNEPHDNRQ